HLALGISGEIRTRLIRYRSKMETAEDYFPRIERVNDDIGNIWTPEKEKLVRTGSVLRVGDVITFTVTATHPQGVELEYAVVSPFRHYLSFQKNNVLSI